MLKQKDDREVLDEMMEEVKQEAPRVMPKTFTKESEFSNVLVKNNFRRGNEKPALALQTKIESKEEVINFFSEI